MDTYKKLEKWSDPTKKLFAHQVGFTGPPMDFDAAPSDFLRISPRTVGVHGRLLHAPGYAHELTQRVDNFHQLEDVVHCFANAGANVVGQVGTNWVHAGGREVGDIRTFVAEVSERYQTPLHMAGLTLVEACEAMGYERVALNSVYYWPDWRDGIARFLSNAGLDLVWFGNFVDQGFYPDQEAVNELSWVFPGDLAAKSCERTLELAGDVDAILVNGMPNFVNDEGIPERYVDLAADIEEAIDTPVLAADLTLYWQIYRTLGETPLGRQGSLLSTLQASGGHDTGGD